MANLSSLLLFLLPLSYHINNTNSNTDTINFIHCVVAIEKGAFRSPSSMIANFFILITHNFSIIKCYHMSLNLFL